MTFQGSDVTEDDTPRLIRQISEIRELMMDGNWRSLQEISDTTGHPHASISAQLRNLRKLQHGGYIVNKKNEGNGFYLYQLEAPSDEHLFELANPDPLMKLSKKELVLTIKRLRRKLRTSGVDDGL